MPDIFTWGSFAFYVKPSGIRGVKDIEISAGCETEDSVVDAEKFVSKKNSDKYQVTLTAIVDASLGENVQETVLEMTEAARSAEQGYLYAASGKLLPFPFMLTEAKASDIDIAHSGLWTHAEIKMTLKQCAKYDGSTLTGGGDSKTPLKTKGTQTPATKVTDALKDPENKQKTQAKIDSLKAELAAKQQSGKMEENVEAARKRMSGSTQQTGTLCIVDTKIIKLDPAKIGKPGSNNTLPNGISPR